MYNAALLNSGFVIEDPSEISATLEQILRAELGLERTGSFEEMDVDLDQEEEDEGIEEEIPEETVGEQVEIEEPQENEDL